MRWSATLISLVVFIVSITAGEPLEERSVADNLAQIPECALSCLITAVSNSSCSLDDQGCICRTTSIEDNATPCILDACTFTDALTAKNVSKTACGAPIRDKAPPYNVMAITLGVITNILVAIRLIYKRFFTGRHELGQDDWVIMLAMVIGIACTAINVDGLTKHGLGKDVWTLQPHTLVEFGKFFYSMEVLYLAEMSLIKLSLSLFYLHIFPGTAIRRMIWATVIANIACAVIFVIAGIIQCIPIDYFWLRYVDSSSKGHCININTFGWTHAAISIAIDVWMIAIPFSQLGKLNLHWKKKVGVIVMFLTGFFVTVVSILRLKSLIYLARSTNPTWDQWDVAFWSTIEVHTGMICTSLPTLRLILVRLCPRVFSTDSSRNMSAGYEPRLTPISQPRDLELSGLDERPHSKATLSDDKQSFTT